MIEVKEKDRRDAAELVRCLNRSAGNTPRRPVEVLRFTGRAAAELLGLQAERAAGGVLTERSAAIVAAGEAEIAAAGSELHVEVLRTGLVDPDGAITVSGRVVLAALTNVSRLAMGAAGAALVAAPSARTYLEGLVAGRDPARLRVAGAMLLGVASKGNAPVATAMGCAALACGAAVDCEEQSWRPAARVALAFEAMTLGAAAWAARGVRTGFELAALRVARCDCHGRAFAECQDAGCPRFARSAPAEDPAERPQGARVAVLARLEALVEAEPFRVARAAARLALGVVGDPAERRAMLRELADEGPAAGPWRSASSYFTGDRSPRILRAPAVGCAALACAAALAAGDSSRRLVSEAMRPHAWRAVLLAEAAYRACGASGDVRAEVLRAARCDCSLRWVIDCPREDCPTFRPLEQALPVSAVRDEESGVRS